MTLLKLVNTIKKLVETHQNYRTFIEGNIFDINNINTLQYPIFNMFVNNISNVSDSILRYNVTFIYLDRLITDNSNKLQIQSDAIVYLNEIINQLNLDVESGYLYTPFTQAVNDNTAGSFVTLNILIDNGLGDCENY